MKDRDRIITITVAQPGIPMRTRQIVLELAAGCLTMTAAACGGRDSTEPNDPVAAVTISPAATQLTALGETAQLSAAVRTQAGASANATVTWQSSAPQVATVDANGLARAVANGSAQITATAGTVSGTADITVQQVASRVSLTPVRDSIFAGATIQLSASAIDRGNAAIASPRATWSSSDTSIAGVSATGLVTGRKRGQARITARVDTASGGTDIIVRLTSILASRDTVISGPLQVDRFEVPAGRTITLAGDLTLRAEGPVVIDGTIRGDCRAVDIVSLQTVTVRGTLDNTCSVATAPGKALRIVSAAEYTLDAATVNASGSITITNDSTITADTSSLGAPRRVALRSRPTAAANCALGGAIGLGRTRADGASGSPKGDRGTPGDPLIISCKGDLAVQGLTVKAEHGGDGGDGSSTTAGVLAEGGPAGNGGAIFLISRTMMIVDGAALIAGNGGKGGSASSFPDTYGAATAFGVIGGQPGFVFLRAPQIVFQGNPSRIELGKGGDGGDAVAVALDGADATLTQAAQQGSAADAIAGRGGETPGGSANVIGYVLRGQIQNAGLVTIPPPVGGKGGNADVSPGNGGNSNILTYPHGANGGAGRIRPGPGGDVRIFDNRPGRGLALGTPGGTGNGSIRRGDGGLGVPDCVLPVFHLGGDGGDGSIVNQDQTRPGEDALNRRSPVVGKIEVIDALNGRHGRDGVPPGNGGKAGVVTANHADVLPTVDVGTSRTGGRTGLNCPPTTSTNPICDPQITPQASFVLQISRDVFAGNPNAFCANATSNLSTGQVIHTVPTVDPKARVLNHTSFNIVGGGTYPITAGGAPANPRSSGTYQITADGADALNTKYPCGPHANGLTHCVQTSPLTAGPFVVVFGIMNGNIPLADGGNLYQYAFVFDRDNNPANNYTPPPQFANDFFKGTDQWYQAQYNPRSAGFSFSARRVVNNASQQFSTSARLILNGATWFLIVPASEFSVPDPMVRFTAFRHTGNFGLTGDWDGDLQRPVDQPLWALPIQPNSSPTTGRP